MSPVGVLNRRPTFNRGLRRPADCGEALIGACCDPDRDICLGVMSQSDCTKIFGGTWLGPGTDCGPPNPCELPRPLGACCIGENCTIRTQPECAAAGGTWLGPGTDCGPPNPCEKPEPIGACCVGQVCHPGQTLNECNALGGTWLGPGTNCGPPNPCFGAPCPICSGCATSIFVQPTGITANFMGMTNPLAGGDPCQYNWTEIICPGIGFSMSGAGGCGYSIVIDPKLGCILCIGSHCSVPTFEEPININIDFAQAGCNSTGVFQPTGLGAACGPLDGVARWFVAITYSVEFFPSAVPPPECLEGFFERHLIGAVYARPVIAGETCLPMGAYPFFCAALPFQAPDHLTTIIDGGSVVVS